MGQQWAEDAPVYGAMVTIVWRFPGQEKPSRCWCNGGHESARWLPASTQHCQRRMKNPRTQEPVSGGLRVAAVVNMYVVSASVEGLNTV
jgi:hypothetical protein